MRSVSRRTSKPSLMIVASVRIHSASRLVSDGHLHLMSIAKCNNVSREKRSVIRNHSTDLIAINHVHRDSIKVATILLKHEELGRLLGNGVHRKNNLVGPLLYRNQQLQTLAGLILP